MEPEKGNIFIPYIMKSSGTSISDRFGTFKYDTEGKLIKKSLTRLGLLRERKDKIRKLWK